MLLVAVLAVVAICFLLRAPTLITLDALDRRWHAVPRWLRRAYGSRAFAGAAWTLVVVSVASMVFDLYEGHPADVLPTGLAAFLALVVWESVADMHERLRLARRLRD